MIYTSYFAMIKKIPSNFHPVSIARYTPKGIDIPKILQVAPTGDILSEYKKTQNKENYIKRYTEEVLKKYTAKEFLSMIQNVTGIPDVAENPNKHVVLCCYEKSEDFCHRHLFADFLSKENIPVKELSLKELEKDKDAVKTLTFTGRRPKYLFGYEDKQSYLILCRYLYTKVERLFKEGFTRFISGGAQGFDQCAFRVVNALKKHYPDAGIKNILYLPCKNQAGKWGDTGLFGKSEYEKMLKAADEIRYISDEYTNRCLIERNHAMVDDSDAVIGLFSDETYEKLYSSGTAECLNYAKDKGIDIYQITYSKNDILNTLSFKQYCNKDICSLFGVTKGIICQQVNCQGVMGAGLAKVIMDKFPIVKIRYDENFKMNKGFQFGTSDIVVISDNLKVANIYSQDKYGNPSKTKEVYTDKDKLIENIVKISKDFAELPVYIPIGIGCGYGGENWDLSIYPSLKQAVSDNSLKNVYILDTKSLQIARICNKDRDITDKTARMHDNTTEKQNTDIGEYMLKKQADLATQYKYKPLPPLISKIQRQEYEDNLPEYWKNYKEGNIYTLDGVLIATGLTDRKYVCGDYGIFLEIDNQSIVKQNIVIKKGQEYRINDPKYSEHVKYQWFCPKSGMDAKLYFQQKGVTYADYKPGMWYVSPYEVIEDTELAKLDKDNIQTENNCIYDYD